MALTRRNFSSIPSRASAGFGRPSVRYEGCREVDLGIRVDADPDTSRRHHSIFQPSAYALTGSGVNPRNTTPLVTANDWVAALVSVAVAVAALGRQMATVTVSVGKQAMNALVVSIRNANADARQAQMTARHAGEERRARAARFNSSRSATTAGGIASSIQSTTRGQTRLGVPGLEVMVQSNRGMNPPPFVPRVRTAAEMADAGVAVLARAAASTDASDAAAWTDAVEPQMISGNCAGPNVAVLVGGAEIPAPPAPHTQGSTGSLEVGRRDDPQGDIWSPVLGGASGEPGALVHPNAH